MAGRPEGGTAIHLLHRTKLSWVSACIATCLLLWIALPALASPACPPGDAPYPRFYQDGALFERAMQKVADVEPANERPSGIVVPHHLLADELVALGFRAASGFDYKRIVILAPDHFRAADRLFATTTRDFETVFGKVGVDRDAVETLTGKGNLVETSCLFGKEHGVQALLPFIQRTFPRASIVPVAISIRSGRADWDRLAAALEPILDADTLVVESTDFSHYLPQHEARAFDQQTLNVLAGGDLDQIAALRQPSHADSVSALYIQTKLQRQVFSASPLVIANDNSQSYSDDHVAETTSYMVILYGRFGPGASVPVRRGDDVVYLGGDTNFGRAMKMALIADGAAERVAEAVLAITGGRPLVVNLEGVILPNVPEALDNMTLAMPEDLTIGWLKRLNVAAVGLANNHAMDLGESGYAETLAALKAAGIASFGQGEALSLGNLDIVGLSDLDTNASRQVDLLTPELLDRLVRPDAQRAVVSFVHWGREYVTSPSSRETQLAGQMRQRGVALIAGAHPHVASPGLTALAGGETLMAYSLGNFLFDQNADKSSGKLLEVRAFRQGTVFARRVPLHNLFDLAKN
ncbi:MAG: AmmeMemoRadiSam system protein B [Rhizobiaceae bacterium]|nr:AmmeMemoRadiSam system protein B [Rhizobiaceae bacterium]